MRTKICAAFVILLFATMSVGYALDKTVGPSGSGANYITDGVQDETQINQALDAVSAGGGGTVYLIGPNTYRVDAGSIKISSNTTLTNSGSGVVVKLKDSASWAKNVPIITSKSTGMTNITVAGFEVNGNAANNLNSRNYGQDYYDCLYFSGCTNISIHNMNLHHNLNDGLCTSGCKNVDYYNNTINTIGHDGYYGYNSTNIDVYGNTIACHTNSGVRLDVSDNARVYQNTIYTPSGNGGNAGVQISCGTTRIIDSVSVYENTIYDTNYAGMWIYSFTNAQAGSNIKVHHNTLYNCGVSNSDYAGGIVTCGFNLTIENNVFDGNHGAGISTRDTYASGNPAGSGYVLTIQNNFFGWATSAGTAGAGYGIWNSLSSMHSMTNRNNCYYSNASTNYYGSNITTSNCITGTDPLFANRTGRDYHEKSTGGRYSGGTWVNDTVDSPLINAGYTGSPYTNELEDNGDRINIGRWGNTDQASKTPGSGGSDDPVPPTVYVARDGSGDFNCDGTADQVEINQALDYVVAHAADGFTTVSLKTGTYTISDSIRIGSKTTLTGVSTAVIKLVNSAGWAANKPMITGISTGRRDITIYGFEIDANDANQSEAFQAYYYNCIYFVQADNIVIHDMKMHNSKNDLIKTRTVDSLFVYGCNLYDSGHSAIYSTYGTKQFIHDNTIVTRQSSGINLYNTNGVDIYKNTISASGSGRAGIEIQKSGSSYAMDDIDIYENTIHDTYNAGMMIYSNGADSKTTSNARIWNNLLYDTGTSTAANDSLVGGIIINGFTAQLSNNTLDGCYGAAVATRQPTGSAAVGTGYTITLLNDGISNTRAHTYGGYLGNGCGIYNYMNTVNTVTADYVGLSGNYSNGQNCTRTNVVNGDPQYADRANHDYHEMSTVGRYNGASWVTDATQSPWIDAGHPSSIYSTEPENNGNQINVGCYGNTAYASKSNRGYKVVAAPSVFNLLQNVPNPFNPSTTISYTIASEGMVTLKVYSASGQLVGTLVDEVKAPGSYSITWEADGLASGMYFCKLQAGNFTKTSKMIFMK